MTFGDPTIRLDPIHAAWNTVASFGTYEEAQEAVDRLSDSGFPVENIDIIGSDLRTVERVTGRLTKRNAAAAGAASGAWFGLFIGLLVGLFTTGADVARPDPRWLAHRCRLGRRLRVRRARRDRRPARFRLEADPHGDPLRHRRPWRARRRGAGRAEHDRAGSPQGSAPPAPQESNA